MVKMDDEDAAWNETLFDPWIRQLAEILVGAL
jgi:hypothetical protein